MIDCGLCGGGASDFFLNAGERRLVKCSGCGLVYTKDFDPAGEEYREDYYAGENRTVSRWDEFCAIFDALLSKVQRYKYRGKLLDVGSGAGMLLAAAEKRGFAAKGVEISEWASAFAVKEKGLDVFHGTLENARFDPGIFDVAVLNHVLEHVRDPLSVLAETRRVLKHDGLLVVGAPNIGSIMARLRGASWPSLKPDEHRWHFTGGTLRALLFRANFKTVYFEARENHRAAGWNPGALARRLINPLSVVCGASEAMLLFAEKGDKLV